MILLWYAFTLDPNKSILDEFKDCMMRKFKMPDLGLLHYVNTRHPLNKL